MISNQLPCTQLPLQALIDRLQLSGEGHSSRWLGERENQRYALVSSIWIREIEGEDAGPAKPCLLRDISNSGLGLLSKSAYETDATVHVEFSINNRTWRNFMRVVHCTESPEGYVLGLKPLHSISATAPSAPIGTEEISVAAFRQQYQLQHVRSEILASLLDYRRAKKTLGFMRNSLKNRISELLKGLEPAAAQPASSNRRQAERLLMRGKARQVFHGPGGFRVNSTEILDVSATGAGIVLPEEAVAGQTGSHSQEILERYQKTPLFIGLNRNPNTLWVPAYVVHSRPDGDGNVRLGLRFNLDNFDIDL